jgi:hypothetical protein
MTTYRIRKLSKTGAGEWQATGRGAFHALSGQAGAVFEVTAAEREVSADEVRKALETGLLRSSDLVLHDGSWVTLLDAPPFLDEAAHAHRREQRWHFARNAVLALAAIGSVIGYIVLQMWLGPR